MILIEEAIQTIQSIYSKGLQSKDTRLVSRHIYSAAISARATLIRQRSNNGQAINSECYQVLTCVEMEQASATECNLIPASSSVVLRSKLRLPAFITDLSRDLIRDIYAADSGSGFDIIEYEASKYRKGNKYTSNKPVVFLRDGRLYITVLTQPTTLVVDGLFQDPLEVHEFREKTDCASCKCMSAYEVDFAFDREQMKALGQLAMQELVILFTQMKEDKVNNASDDITISGNMVNQPQQYQQQQREQDDRQA